MLYLGATIPVSELLLTCPYKALGTGTSQDQVQINSLATCEGYLQLHILKIRYMQPVYELPPDFTGDAF